MKEEIELPHYKSGRTRRLVVSGHWNALVEATYECTNEWPTFPNRFATVSEQWPEFIEIRALGMVAKFNLLSTFGSWPANSTCSNSVGSQVELSQEIVIGEGLSFESIQSNSTIFDYIINDGSNVSIDCSAPFEFWADLEEWFEVIEPILESDEHGFPTFGGESVIDSVRGRGIRFYELLKVGGEVGLELGGIVPLHHSLDITTSIRDDLGEVDYFVDKRSQIFVENGTGILTIAANLGGEPTQSDYYVENESSTFDARDGYLLRLSRGVGDGAQSYGYSASCPLTRLKWRGDFFVGADILSDNYTVNLQKARDEIQAISVEGARIEEWSQKSWSSFAVLAGEIMEPLSYDDRSKVRHWIDSDSLSTHSDEVADWRLQFRGRQWLTHTISHPEEVELENGSDFELWVGTGVDIEPGLFFTTTSTPAQATKYFLSPINSETYRYLELRLRSISSSKQKVDLAIGEKSWIITTGDIGEWVTVRIDLCRPDNMLVLWDNKESRFPLSIDNEVVDSEHWGVSKFDSISLHFEESAQVFEINKITLKRIGNAQLTVMPPLREWLDLSNDSEAQIKPLGWVAVNGKITDFYGMQRVGNELQWTSLTDLGTQLTQLGLNVNPGLAIGDGYHANLREAELLWGGGVRCTEITAISGCNLPFSDELELMAQALWDEVEIYPTAGSIWEELGEFGGTTVLGSAKVLRSAAWGLVLSATSVRVSESVELRTLDLTRGLGTTDGQGTYLTHLPGGLEYPEHFVKVGGTVSDPFYPKTRMRHRRVLREDSSSRSVSFDWHPSGMAVRGSIGDDHLVRIAVKGNQPGSEYHAVATELSAENLSVRWSLDRRASLHLVTQEDEQIILRASHDLGESWNMALTLASGNVKYPCSHQHLDGRFFVYWIEDGSVNGAILDSSGILLQSIFEARVGVDEKGLAIGAYNLPTGQVVLELITIESDSVVSSLSTDGVIFS